MADANPQRELEMHTGLAIRSRRRAVNAFGKLTEIVFEATPTEDGSGIEVVGAVSRFVQREEIDWTEAAAAAEELHWSCCDIRDAFAWARQTDEEEEA